MLESPKKNGKGVSIPQPFVWDYPSFKCNADEEQVDYDGVVKDDEDSLCQCCRFGEGEQGLPQKPEEKKVE